MFCGRQRDANTNTVDLKCYTGSKLMKKDRREGERGGAEGHPQVDEITHP